MQKPEHAQKSSPKDVAPEGTDAMPPATSPQIREMDREENAQHELVLRIASEDLTETDHLAASPRVAMARLKTAAVELVRASVSMVAVLIARFFLARAGSASRKDCRAKPHGVRLSVLSLEKLLEGFIWRRVLGRELALRMLGGRRRKGVDGEKVTSLKVAGRSYQSGQTPSGPGYAAAGDTPRIRVMLGVSVRSNEKPIYRIRRFAEVEPGGFTELAGYHSTDPEDAFRQYCSNPTVERMLTESRGESADGQQDEDATNAEDTSRAA